MWRLSNLLLPITSKIWGYVPAKLGLGEDLPKGVTLEWAKWCKTPNYFMSYIGLDFGHNFFRKY
jgi:predicted alpha/beta hydrolase